MTSSTGRELGTSGYWNAKKQENQFDQLGNKTAPKHLAESLVKVMKENKGTG